MGDEIGMRDILDRQSRERDMANDDLHNEGDGLLGKQKDPDGLYVETPGAKMDVGKVQASLLRHFSRALLAVAEIGTYGTEVKGYARGGWQEVKGGIHRYDDAKWRHLLEEEIQPLDSESQLLHAKHEAWNTLARLELILRDYEGAGL